MAQVKISDLSVGDWVEIDGNDFQINGINASTGLVRLQGKANPVGMGIVMPIPLTPEILEKNGLCVVEEDADFSEYELFGSENFSIFHLKGTLHYRLETPQASLVCWNVHQLQHALRLAGVEKEIEV